MRRARFQSNARTVGSSENLCFSLFSIRFGANLGVGPPQDLVPQQKGGMLGLTHFCFVLDDGGGWTLNRPLPESNGWNASSASRHQAAERKRPSRGKSKARRGTNLQPVVSPLAAIRSVLPT